MTSERFNNAVAYIQGLPPKGDVSPSNTQKLQFYALYKQATEGPNKSQAPSRMQMINRAKWQAWKSLKDMSREEAEKLYLSTLEKLSPGWESRSKTISSKL